MSLRERVRRLADGVVPQAVITGSLSFAHIHDLAATHGQTGWKAWTYPLSVDLLTVAAYRKLVAAHRSPDTSRYVRVLTWCWFLLALTASLAANITATGSRDPLSLAVGVWPAVAFFGCTLLGHATTPQTSTEPRRQTVEHVTVERLTIDTPPTPPPPAGPTATMSQRPDTPALPDVPATLLTFARRIASDHRTATGTLIDPATLRARLNVAEPLALAVHAHLTNGEH